jgi:hypothetical protein
MAEKAGVAQSELYNPRGELKHYDSESGSDEQFDLNNNVSGR